MSPFLIRWLVTTFAVALASKLPGIHTEGWLPLVFMALFLGVINAVNRVSIRFKISRLTALVGQKHIQAWDARPIPLRGHAFSFR